MFRRTSLKCHGIHSPNSEHSRRGFVSGAGVLPGIPPAARGTALGGQKKAAAGRKQEVRSEVRLTLTGGYVRISVRRSVVEKAAVVGSVTQGEGGTWEIVPN